MEHQRASSPSAGSSSASSSASQPPQRPAFTRVEAARTLLAGGGVDRLEQLFGLWMLVGRPVIESRPEDGWSFRTRSLGPRIVKSADGATFAVRGDDVILPLHKTQRSGPFSAAILIGRASSNDVQINHRSVSKLHARVDLSAQPWIEDAGSSNGTTVDEQRLAAGERRTLRSGDVVGFGSCSFQLISHTDLAALLRDV